MTLISGVRIFRPHERLHYQGGELGIVVEIGFFSSQYSIDGPGLPLYYENNIQGVGKCGFMDVQTMKHPDLVQRESEYVSKITQEVNAFDNVILEVCDEPSNFTQHAEAGPWVGHLLQVVHDTEAKLPKKHLVAQMVEGPLEARLISLQVPSVDHCRAVRVGRRSG